MRERQDENMWNGKTKQNISQFLFFICVKGRHHTQLMKNQNQTTLNVIIPISELIWVSNHSAGYSFPFLNSSSSANPYPKLIFLVFVCFFCCCSRIRESWARRTGFSLFLSSTVRWIFTIIKDAGGENDRQSAFQVTFVLNCVFHEKRI